jgi:NAD(P)-dependent dehydrogenase (short-subunit alcohol dehydrogenase family)
MFDLTGKIALTTGIGAPADALGNGKAIAMLLAQQGAVIEGTDINVAAGAATVDQIVANGGKAECSAVNATDADGVKQWVDDCYARHGRIDILVNNVGQSEPGGPIEMDAATWRAQIALNLDAAFYTMQASLPYMVAAKSGSIINISSIAGQRYIGKPQVGYAAAKAGLVQLTKTTAVIHAKDNVRLNCVVPGLMHTPMLKRMADKYAGGDLAGFIAKRDAMVPMRRMGDAHDVANAVLFLAADESRYITATEIVVDGGITAATQGDLPE